MGVLCSVPLASKSFPPKQQPCDQQRGEMMHHRPGETIEIANMETDAESVECRDLSSYFSNLQDLLQRPTKTRERIRAQEEEPVDDPAFLDPEGGAEGARFGMTMDDVVEVWGLPKSFDMHQFGQQITLHMKDMRFSFTENSLVGMEIPHMNHMPHAKFSNGIGFGSTLDAILEAFGPPDREMGTRSLTYFIDGTTVLFHTHSTGIEAQRRVSGIEMIRELQHRPLPVKPAPYLPPAVIETTQNVDVSTEELGYCSLLPFVLQKPPVQKHVEQSSDECTLKTELLDSYYHRLLDLVETSSKPRCHPSPTTMGVSFRLIDPDIGANGIRFGMSMDDVIHTWGMPRRISTDVYRGSGSSSNNGIKATLHFQGGSLMCADDSVVEISLTRTPGMEAKFFNGVGIDSTLAHVRDKFGPPQEDEHSSHPAYVMDGTTVRFQFNTYGPTKGLVIAITLTRAVR